MTKIESFLGESHPKKTYFDTLQKFLRRKQKQNVSTSTISRLFYTLHPIGIKLNNPKIKAIKTETLHQYIKELWLSYSPDTVRTVTADAKHFWAWVKKNGYGRNIAKKLPAIKTRPQLKAPPETDIHTVLTSLSQQVSQHVHRDLFKNLIVEGQPDQRVIKAIRDTFIITFLYESGARAGELVNLGTRIMEKSLSTGTAVFSIPVTGKTNYRQMYITSATAEVWHIWQQIRPPENNQYAITGWHNGSTPHPMTTNSISQMIVRRCEQANVKPFRAHALRHAKIKRSRRTVGIEITSELVDHSLLESTFRYANIDSEELAAAAIKTGLTKDIWKPEPQ